MNDNKRRASLNFLTLKSGLDGLDRQLRNGFSPGIIHIYGPPNTGKSNFAMQLVLNAITTYDSEPIWIDTNNNFEFRRLIQMTGNNIRILRNFKYLNPINYDEFKILIENIPKIIDNKTMVLVIDPITYFYRLNVNLNNWFGLKRDLIKILGKFIGISVKNHLIIILVNQIKGHEMKLEAVCQDILELYSKYSLLFENKNGLTITLRKLRNIKLNKKFKFKISNNGLSDFSTKIGID